MKNTKSDNVKLGVFVLLGLVGLVALLYFIGANQNLFGKRFPLQVTFKNVSGLRVGNNIRFVGIDIGTVKKIVILNDTAVNVHMNIDEKIAPFIKQNDVANIGTDGLMGNKVVNIEPGPPGSPRVEKNGTLKPREVLDMDALMRTLDVTNRNVARMSEDLVTIVQRVSKSVAIWEILEDPSLPAHIRSTLVNVRQASERANLLAGEFQQIVHEIGSSPEGIVALMKDSVISRDIRSATSRIRALGVQAESMGAEMELAVKSLSNDIQHGNGPLQAALRDSILTLRLQKSLLNVQKGTDNFNQSMEALKNNILFRGYFKRKEKQVEQEAKLEKALKKEQEKENNKE